MSWPRRDRPSANALSINLPSVAALPGFEHVDADAVYAVLEENARFMEDLVAPLNRVGDEQGSVRQEDGTVTTPDGFKEAYKAYVDAGWNGVAFPTEYGGGGFPWLVGVAMQEVLTSAKVTEIADRHYMIERGRVVWSGTSAQLAAAPDIQHRYLGI